MLERVKETVDEGLLKQSFLYTFIIGLVAHGYCFLNLLISHDSLNDFYVSDQWERAGFGRIFYSIYISLTRGRIVLPWLIGVLTLCWIAVAVYLIAKLFDLKKCGLVFLISGICVTNPTVYTLAATYIHDLDADMFAMMLSVAAVYCWHLASQKTEMKTKSMWLLIGAVSLSVSLGIYQSFIALSITLVIFCCLKALLEQKEFKVVLTNGCFAIGMMTVAAVLYIIELKVFEVLTGVSTMNSATYNGVGNVAAAFSGNVISNVLDTYMSFIGAFKNFITTSYPEMISVVLLGVTACIIVVIALLGLKEMDWKCRGLFAVLSALLPFAMNITYFLSGGMAHVLTQYAVWMLYLLAVVLVCWYEKENHPLQIKKAVYVLLVCGLFFTVTENIQTANTVYVKKDLEYQATLSYMTRVADHMEEQEGYIPGETPVLIIGQDVIGISKPGFERYGVLTGVSGTGAVTYQDTYKDYFKYVLARPVSLGYDDELKNSEEVLDMPVFPEKGSVQMIDEMLVVKLADN